MKSRASISDERLSSDRERMRFYPLPTDSVIRSTLDRFEKSDYCAKEREIIAFFQRLPLNNNRADVLLKATALKSFMGSPNIYLPFITHYILSEKDFDNKLQRGVKSIVDGITASSRARWKYASFARRYCAFHRPDLYLGSGWEIGLVMYERLYGFMQGESFSGGTRYAAHTKPFWIFREFYGLEKYSLPDLQHFLRQLYHEESEHNEHYHAVFESIGVKVKKLPPFTPQMNARIENFIRAIKTECLDKIIFTSEMQLRIAIGEYLEYWNHYRPHAGLGGNMVKPYPQDMNAPIREVTFLGGLLHGYRRESIAA